MLTFPSPEAASEYRRFQRMDAVLDTVNAWIIQRVAQTWNHAPMRDRTPNPNPTPSTYTPPTPRD